MELRQRQQMDTLEKVAEAERETGNGAGSPGLGGGQGREQGASGRKGRAPLFPEASKGWAAAVKLEGTSQGHSRF